MPISMESNEQGRMGETLPNDVLEMANDHFPTIKEGAKNSTILINTLNIPDLTAKIVSVLKREEEAWNWPLKDEDIKKGIEKECLRHKILLPIATDIRQRWFCLIYLGSSVLEEFSCGNLVRLEDITGEDTDED